MIKSGLVSLGRLLFVLWLTGQWGEDTFMSGILFVVLWAACWLFVHESFFKEKME